MISTYSSRIAVFGKYMRNNLPALSGSINYPSGYPQISVRTIQKHWDPKWKKQRREKFVKVELPNFNEEHTSEVYLKKLGNYGLRPQRQWREREVLITSTPGVFESYIIPEGDGKFSAMTKQGAKQKLEIIEKKSKSYFALRKIRYLVDNFHTKDFPDEGLDIYIKAHEALAAKNKDTLIQYVTETAYPKIIHNAADKTIHWRFLESLEPARLVHARCATAVSDSNIFAQLTVRFHTQQILAVYDRFGRLMQGSEILRKDVLEYVIFERHLSNMYGKWRIHAKIVPSWIKPEAVGEKTYMQEIEEQPRPEVAHTSVMQDATGDGNNLMEIKS